MRRRADGVPVEEIILTPKASQHRITSGHGAHVESAAMSAPSRVHLLSSVGSGNRRFTPRIHDAGLGGSSPTPRREDTTARVREGPGSWASHQGTPAPRGHPASSFSQPSGGTTAADRLPCQSPIESGFELVGAQPIQYRARQSAKRCLRCWRAVWPKGDDNDGTASRGKGRGRGRRRPRSRRYLGDADGRRSSSSTRSGQAAEIHE